jgi:hypothetical protein
MFYQILVGLTKQLTIQLNPKRQMNLIITPGITQLIRRHYHRTKSGSGLALQKGMLEIIESGAAQTPFLRFGDRVRIEMLDAQGHSVFGAIDQRVCKIEANA